MISYLLGLPGSGKTYFAVDRIYNNFSDNEDAKRDKKVTFKNCYTNINEFKFDTVVNVYPLDFDELYKIFTRCHAFYKAKKSDDYIVKFLRRLKLTDTLFVIDEAHNYFDKKDIVLVWWLSYHRHLYHEIILITQSLSLIESKYKQFSEFFYEAKPQSLTLDKRYFKYNVYCSSRLSQKSKSGVIKIKRNKEVFKLYKSGDSINSSNIILKFLFIALLIFSLVIAILYYFKTTHTIKNNSEVQKDIPVQSKSIKSKSVLNTVNHFNSANTSLNDDDVDYIDLKFFRLSCSISVCNNDVISLPPQLLRKFIDKKNITLLYEEKRTDLFSVFYLQSSKDFYQFLLPHIYKRKHDEKINGDGLSIFNRNTSSK